MYATCPNCGHEFFVGTVPTGPLAAARQKVGLSINQAALKVGVSSQLLGMIEKGRANPRLSTMRKMSQLYGEPIEKLWPDDEEPEASPNGAESESSEDESDEYVPDQEDE